MLFSDRMELEKAFNNWAETNSAAKTPMNVAAFIDLHPEWLERFSLLKKMRARQKEVMDRYIEDDVKLSDHDRIEVERCRREVYAEEYEKIKERLEAHPLKLKTKGEHDFILEGADEFWVEIGNIVVYIRKTEDAVTVDLTPAVSAHETLDCCSADFGMAKEFECTECGKYNNDGEGFNGLCGSCADKAETQPQCGHPKSAIVSSDHGTSYCGTCEEESREEP
jgi:hypothetical protein